MSDARLVKLARVLVRYSLGLQAGQLFQINTATIAADVSGRQWRARQNSTSGKKRDCSASSSSSVESRSIICVLPPDDTQSQRSAGAAA